MKKHYERMTITPLGMGLESSLMVLQGSIVDNAATVESMGQDVENYYFDGTTSGFHVDWD